MEYFAGLDISMERSLLQNRSSFDDLGLTA